MLPLEVEDFPLDILQRDIFSELVPDYIALGQPGIIFNRRTSDPWP